MMIILLFSLLTSVYCETVSVACCLPDQGLLVDDENFCETSVTKIRSPITMNCNKTVQVPISFFNFTISEDGNLRITEENYSYDVDNGKFCTGKAVNDTRGLLVFCRDTEEQIINYFDPLTRNIVGYCMIISVIFLMLTTIVYCILPEIRDLQGKSIINLCGSLAIACAIQTTKTMTEFSDIMNLCIVKAFLTYFFLVASLFWMSSLAIQMLVYLKRPFVYDYSWRTFSWYALYAWGCPALLTICMAIVNFHPGQHEKPIKLNFCWFFNKKQQWYYMYSVMSIIIISNTLIFSYISISLWRQTFPSSHVKAMRYKFMMSVRLFILLGLQWIPHLVSTFFSVHIIWIMLDIIINSLHGPATFLLLVVFRRRVIKALFKHGYLECISGMVEKHVAVAEDDEDIIQHTADVTLDDRI